MASNVGGKGRLQAARWKTVPLDRRVSRNVELKDPNLANAQYFLVQGQPHLSPTNQPHVPNIEISLETPQLLSCIQN